MITISISWIPDLFCLLEIGFWLACISKDWVTSRVECVHVCWYKRFTRCYERHVRFYVSGCASIFCFSPAVGIEKTDHNYFHSCTPDINDGSASTNADGFRAVPYSYGSSSDFSDQKIADMESGFSPPFPVPDYLLQHLVSYCFGRLFP